MDTLLSAQAMFAQLVLKLAHVQNSRSVIGRTVAAIAVASFAASV